MKWYSSLTLLVCCSLTYAQIDLQNLEIPDIDDIEAIKERCEKKGGNGTYEKVKSGKEALQVCLTGLVEFDVLKNELDEAKKTGSMDEVFGKYCAKKPKVQSCVENFTNTIKPCLEESEKHALNITLDILRQLGEFVCYRDGDRIAMFVAEGGVECIKDHVEGIKTCVNNTLKVNASINTNSLPVFLIDKQKCDDLSKLQTCVVEELEKCKDSTPANIIDALFRFVKRSACPNKTKRSLHLHKIMKRSTELFDKISQERRSKMIEILEETCKANAGDDGFNQLTSSLRKSMNCIRDDFRMNPESILSGNANQLKATINSCTKESIGKAKNCLPDNNKNYTQFYMDIVYSTIDFMYANMDRMKSYEIKKEAADCLKNMNNQEISKGLIECSSIDEDTNEEIIFTKVASCDRINSLAECANSQLKKVCTSSTGISTLVRDYFNVLKTVCNDNEHKKE